MENKRYESPRLETFLFEPSFIRTSYGNDGNDDWWDDGDARPIQNSLEGGSL